MKIINITSYITEGVYYVRIYTDEGVSGFGECSRMHNDAVCTLIHKTIKPALIGMNPFDSEKLKSR